MRDFWLRWFASIWRVWFVGLILLSVFLTAFVCVAMHESPVATLPMPRVGIHNARAAEFGCFKLYNVEREFNAARGTRSEVLGDPVACPGGELWVCSLPRPHAECWSGEEN